MNLASKQIESTKDLFNKLSINENTLSKDQKKFINENGFLVLPPPKFIKKNLEKLNQIVSDLIKKEGIKGGWEGKEENYREGGDSDVASSDNVCPYSKRENPYDSSKSNVKHWCNIPEF